MVGLKTVEAYVVFEEVVLEIVASNILNTNETSINMNLVYKDYFDCTSLNYISLTPTPIPLPNQYKNHISRPVYEPIIVRNQLIVFPAFE